MVRAHHKLSREDHPLDGQRLEGILTFYLGKSESLGEVVSIPYQALRML